MPAPAGVARRFGGSHSSPKELPTMGKTVAHNRKARHLYIIEDTLEAGIELTGTEIKSVRDNNVNLQDAYARIENGEAWLVGVHIAPWAGGNRNNHEPQRTRKLLLHRRQIDELMGRTKAKGLTLVPLSLYFNDRGRAKVEIGLARGKKNYDHRRDIAARDARRDMDREVSDAMRGR
jgi:SsrA-binding protein